MDSVTCRKTKAGLILYFNHCKKPYKIYYPNIWLYFLTVILQLHGHTASDFLCVQITAQKYTHNSLFSWWVKAWPPFSDHLRGLDKYRISPALSFLCVRVCVYLSGSPVLMPNYGVMVSFSKLLEDQQWLPGNKLGFSFQGFIIVHMNI